LVIQHNNYLYSFCSTKPVEQAIESLVLLVHHTGKDHSKGLRRHSSIHVALDAEIVVNVDKHKLRAWEVVSLKMKRIKIVLASNSNNGL